MHLACKDNPTCKFFRCFRNMISLCLRTWIVLSSLLPAVSVFPSFDVEKEGHCMLVLIDISFHNLFSSFSIFKHFVILLLSVEKIIPAVGSTSAAENRYIVRMRRTQQARLYLRGACDPRYRAGYSHSKDRHRGIM